VEKKKYQGRRKTRRGLFFGEKIQSGVGDCGGGYCSEEAGAV